MRVRAAGLLLALAVGLGLGLVGCGDPNAGSAASDEFDTWWPDHRVDGFEATSSGDNTLPFAGELDVTVTAAADVTADDVDRVRDVVCSFEPDANASVSVTLVAGVLTAWTPCACSALESAAFLEVDRFLADLGAESAEVGHLSSPSIDVVMPDRTEPARARQVVRRLADHLPTVPGIFVDLQGEPSLTSPDSPIEVSVRVGSTSYP